jgi:hypothetical protein
VRHGEWDRLHNLVQEAVASVLGAIGLDATYVGAIPHDAALWTETMSFISLDASNLKGSLALSIPEVLLSRSHPARATAPEDTADWLAELANLALGRIKSRLLVYDVSIALSTPIIISSTELRLGDIETTLMVHEFRADDFAIYMMFECVCDEDAIFGPAREGSVFEAGELIIF